MSFELDHVFIATTNPQEVEEALKAFGLTFSRRTRHPGQGTQNACALFDNAFFEILWPDDDAEIRSAAVSPLGLWERAHWPETGACPFGISYRPSSSAEPPQLPETWNYEAAYRPGGGIPIVTPRNVLAEPLIFISNGGRRPANYPTIVPTDLLHCGAQRTVTAVRITRTGNEPFSPGLRWFCDRGLLTVEEGSRHLVELEWDHGMERQVRDFPAAAIRFRW